MASIGAIEFYPDPNRIYVVVGDSQMMTKKDLDGIVEFLTGHKVNAIPLLIDDIDGTRIPNSLNAVHLEFATDDQLNELMLAAQEILGRRIIKRLEK